jgi:hypothetical protein
MALVGSAALINTHLIRVEVHRAHLVVVLRVSTRKSVQPEGDHGPSGPRSKDRSDPADNNVSRPAENEAHGQPLDGKPHAPSRARSQARLQLSHRTDGRAALPIECTSRHGQLDIRSGVSRRYELRMGRRSIICGLRKNSELRACFVRTRCLMYSPQQMWRGKWLRRRIAARAFCGVIRMTRCCEPTRVAKRQLQRFPKL